MNKIRFEYEFCSPKLPHGIHIFIFYGMVWICYLRSNSARLFLDQNQFRQSLSSWIFTYLVLKIVIFVNHLLLKSCAYCCSLLLFMCYTLCIVLTLSFLCSGVTNSNYTELNQVYEKYKDQGGLSFSFPSLSSLCCFCSVLIIFSFSGIKLHLHPYYRKA